MPNPDPLPDSVVSLLEAAVIVTVAGRLPAARVVLEQLQVPDYARMQRFKAQVPGSSRPTLANDPSIALHVRPQRRSPTPREYAALYRRDHFTCRYCGTRTILLHVLYLLSAIHPDVFPVEVEHWARPTHPVYWGYSSSFEHLVPVIDGGTNDLSNLVTACARCNYGKGSTRLEQLGWQPVPIIDSDWDGLSGYYPALFEQAPAEAKQAAMYGA